jgi:OmpA-OmpF porin, OOP family
MEPFSSRPRQILGSSFRLSSLSKAALFAAVPLALLGATTRTAHAQAKPSIDLRGFTPSVAPDGTLYNEPTSTPGAGAWNMGAFVSYAHRPLVLRNDAGDTRLKLVSGQLSFDAAGSVGLGKRGAIGIALPLVAYQNGQTSPSSRQVFDGGLVPKTAWGDLALIGKYNFKRLGPHGGTGFSMLSRLTLPTGTTSAMVGEGNVTAEARGLFEYKLVFVSVLATAGFKARASERAFGGSTWGNEVPWGAALSLRPQALGLDKKGRWTWGVEGHGALPVNPSSPFTNAQVTPAYVGATARYTVKDTSILAGVESGVTKAAGSAPVRGVLAISWAPREHDLDHDGVPDDVDECMGLAEDRDGFEDGDGCPEMDNDDDGVLDPDDKCPKAQEDEDGFQDEDGCPDLDNDQDGIPDTEDACPDESGPRSTSPKWNGCPIGDKDQDGVSDDKDRCPDEPEDRDGFQDEDGCPDLDNDADGIADTEDACPAAPGIAHVDPKLNGCPSTDTDGDGIANDVDKCPTEAETYNGKDDDDGCPETGKDAKAKPLVTVTEQKGVSRVVLRTRLAFEGGGKDGKPLAIAASSLPQLRAVAALLLQNPTWKLSVAIKAQPKDATSRAELVKAKLVGLVGRNVVTVAELPKKGEPTGVALIVTK